MVPGPENHQCCHSQSEILQACEKIWEWTFDALPDRISILDLDRRIVRANKAAMEHYDSYEGKILGEYCYFALKKCGTVEKGCPHMRTISDGKMHSFLDYDAKSAKHILVTTSPIRNDAGEVIATVHISRDITSEQELAKRQKMTEEHLRQAAKMEAVGRLAGGVAHDFNNLLTGITGNLAIAMAEYATDRNLVEMLEDVHAAADRAALITHQLLAFASKQILDPCTLDVNDRIERLQPMLSRLLARNIEVTFEPQKDAGQVYADPDQLEQVLVSLCLNARDAMPDGGRIHIATQTVVVNPEGHRQYPDLAAGRYVMFSVADSGRGMDDETLSHVFEPFFTTKRAPDGTGLGLASAYGIVRQHGGYMRVESALDHGSTFTVFLPHSEPDREGECDVVLAEQRASGETILLVEDEALARSVGVIALKNQGYRVIEAESLEHAIMLASEYTTTIDLIISDIMTRDARGRDLLTLIGAMHPESKILFISAYQKRQIVGDETLEDGLNYISKPYSPSELAAKVRQVLANI